MSYRDNERVMAQQMTDDAAGDAEGREARERQRFNQPIVPGSVIHEMGTAAWGAIQRPRC